MPVSSTRSISIALVVATGALLTGCGDATSPTTPGGNGAATTPPNGAGAGTTPVKAPPTTQRTHIAVWPDDYFFKDPRDTTAKTRPAASAAIETYPAPPISAAKWYNSEPLDRGQLRGKVVVLHFFGGARPVSMKTIPRNLAFVNKYSSENVVLIGIHDSEKGREYIDDTLKQFGISYPVALDDENRTAKDYKVILWPHYDVIDQYGVLRASGLIPSRVENVVDYVLDEVQGQEGASP